MKFMDVLSMNHAAVSLQKVCCKKLIIPMQTFQRYAKKMYCTVLYFSPADQLVSAGLQTMLDHISDSLLLQFLANFAVLNMIFINMVLYQKRKQVHLQTSSDNPLHIDRLRSLMIPIFILHMNLGALISHY